MKQVKKHAQGWRWLPVTATVLVFLFTFHAKTAVYANGLGIKPHTATSSKLCMTSQKIHKPQAPSCVIARSQSCDFSNPIAGRISLQVELASGFVPVLSFSGLSPPQTLMETT
jgi:hypothetical protein